jgi:hypothetical protein
MNDRDYAGGAVKVNDVAASMINEQKTVAANIEAHAKRPRRQLANSSGIKSILEVGMPVATPPALARSQMQNASRPGGVRRLDLVGS